MDLRPGQEKRRVSEYKRAALEPIRRAFEEDEDWFQDVVEHSHDLLCTHDLKGRLLSVNPAPARVLGYSVDELLQLPLPEIIAPRFQSEFEAYVSQVRKTGESKGLMAVMTRSGERRIWQYHSTLRKADMASPIVRVIAQDITEQRRAERLLREASEDLLRRVRDGERTIEELKLFRTLIDHSNDAIEVIDAETLRFVDVNAKACLALGYSRQEILAMGVQDINLAAGELAWAKVAETVRATGHLVMERTHRRKDGTVFPVEVSLRWVRLERDYVIAVVRDITERKLAEARLAASENSYRAVHDRAPVGICRVEAGTGRFLGVNPKYCEIVGRSEDDLLGRKFQSITHPDDLAENEESFRQIWAGQMQKCQIEKRYVRPDGSLRWVEAEVVTRGPEGAKPNWHMAIVQDITERKQAEKRLREYERVVEGSEEMITVVDREYKYVIANRAFAKHRGMEKEQLIGRGIFEQLGSDGASDATIELIRQKVDECFQGKVVQYEMKYTYPNLGERDLLLKYFPIQGPTGVDRIVAILQDITERKREQEALRRSEENYRMFISQSSEGIFREDMDAPVPVDLPEDELIHHILYDNSMGECNDAMAAMYGFTSGKELVGKRLTEMVVPDDPHNIELTRDYIRSGFRVIDRESHEVDIHGNPKIFLNSMIGTVENGMLVRTWGIQRDITEKVKLEEARTKAEENLRQNVVQLQHVSEDLRLAKEKLAEEKLYLEEAIDSELGFGEIIGRSSALKQVMEKVNRVALSDATVLLLGETGTGKELVARALHRLSRRNDSSFIKLNCAAIPSGLLESELFGHEKGAFTGAVARKIGRLELADRGTLFLDEIGEIPLSLQPKLLRVLQDREFERLGGTQTLKVNFRLLAATNRDLLQSVKAHEFRSDLFYRLNVFPIVLPPLRERREDIRPLIEHFVRKFAAQMKKAIISIPSKTMEMLVRWNWPGNIRELENFVERSVILTPGSVLQAPLAELQIETDNDNAGNGNSERLRDLERERIICALRDCHGKLGGADGAAAHLGLKRTTLQSKLDQLGIKPAVYRV